MYVMYEIPMGYLCVRFVFGYNRIIDMFAVSAATAVSVVCRVGSYIV
jgi:hypothetical protein